MYEVFSKEKIKKIFRNHVAQLKILDENTQTLTWKEPGTRMCQIDFVFFKNMLFVTGDLRNAVFNTTWETSWNCMDGWKIELDYFSEKLSTIEYGKYEWDCDEAVDNLIEYYRVNFEELTDEDYNKVVNYIKQNNITDKIDFDNAGIPYKDIVNKAYLLQMSLAMYYASISSNQEEFIYLINNHSDFNDFNDFWEWGYQCGRVLNSDIEIYLKALQMAYDQLLKKRNYINNRYLDSNESRRNEYDKNAD